MQRVQVCILFFSFLASVSITQFHFFFIVVEDGTIRLWQTDSTKSYGLWQRD